MGHTAVQNEILYIRLNILQNPPEQISSLSRMDLFWIYTPSTNWSRIIRAKYEITLDINIHIYFLHKTSTPDVLNIGRSVFFWS